jgi:hypothetical protein
VVESTVEGVVDGAVADEPALIVTESMAELFLHQGHRELALAVYRQLASRPDHDHLEEKILALESELAEELPEEPPHEEPVRPSFAAESTGGRSVAEVLRDVLNSPPPSVASKVHPPAIERGPEGEPTREADQPFSLATVFSETSPSPSAIAGAEAMSETDVFSGASAEESEPSYDEFFGTTGSNEAEGSVPSRPSETEDLHQFNEWLKGLKR